MNIYADYHTHTRYSHGKGTVMENVAAAVKIGLREIAISDHGPAHMFGIGIKNLSILDQIRQDIQEASRIYKNIKILTGIEANVTSIKGDIDLPEEWRDKVDLLQVGLHLMVRPTKWGEGLVRYGIHYLRGLSPSLRTRSRIINTEAITNAVYRHKIDIITHPGHRMDIDTRELARACYLRNTALELNASHDHITPEFIEISAMEGAKFVIGSDAHTPSRVGDFKRVVELAKEAGLGPEQILNAVN
ncbi:MAG: PHP domain-containing protein [Firmicutes bacterium]|nr:PHP domain-containing protein [Bacillota bacterium]